MCNPTLQNALMSATGRFREARVSAFDELKDSDDLRNIGRKIRENTITSLDKHLLRLEEAVKRNGGYVHWAKNGKEAVDIASDILARNKVKIVVKSKSMTSEEIGLNPALEKIGIFPCETDLGEYIIQLAGEKPSHIIIPAIHKTRSDVSELFFRKFGKKTSAISEMTDLARQNLRDIFFEAGAGITGGNFLVAETGTLVLVENEGNARYTSTIPKIHIAIVGIEKVVPTLECLPILLTLLTRSATGQRISTYVSFINGPVENGKEFHLILLDNGRSDILGDPNIRESLFCIRCGGCLNVCPIYQKIGGHSYGWVYPGPIGSVITPILMGLDKYGFLSFASSLCGACSEICPVKVPIHKILIRLRNKAVSYKAGLFEQWAFRVWAEIMRRPNIYQNFSHLFYLLQKLVPKRVLSKKLLGNRIPPEISKFTFKDWWQKYGK